MRWEIHLFDNLSIRFRIRLIDDNNVLVTIDYINILCTICFCILFHFDNLMNEFYMHFIRIQMSKQINQLEKGNKKI